LQLFSARCRKPFSTLTSRQVVSVPSLLDVQLGGFFIFGGLQTLKCTSHNEKPSMLWSLFSATYCRWKNGDCLKNQCYDPFLPKLQNFQHKTPNFSAKTFKKLQHWFQVGDHRVLKIGKTKEHCITNYNCWHIARIHT
jgi:hypothetical protein